jgi:radical SAM superfamily enzyme YgiQ (UPF0313 family)
MRLVLVDNLLLKDGRADDLFLQPHLGLISLVAVARAAGHSAALYDPKLELARGRLRLGASLYRDIADRLLREEPDVVGLTSLGCNFICTLKIALYLKARNPHLPILLGGPHATILDREILSRFSCFDLVVRNEAELTLLSVLESLSGGDMSKIPGLTYRTSSGVAANPGEPLIADLDTLPFPAFDSYPLEALDLQEMPIEAGRGCPFKCSFCSTATFFGRRYRLKSPERIGTEMDYLHARYGFTRFGLTHDLFTVDRRKVLAFCRYIRGRGYTWGCSARMDCVDEELLEEMAASGCRSIYFGIETGSPRLQKVVDKHLDLSLVEPGLAATRRLGMDAIASFITGFPDEEQSDQDETLDMMGRCFARHTTGLIVQLHLLTPEPGTGLSQRLQTSLDYDGHISDFNFPTLEPDDPEVMQSAPSVFLNHHFYPTRVPRRRNVFVTSIYPTLQGLGYAPIAHLTQFFEGRLSRLLEDMDRWAVQTDRFGPYEDAFVCAYVEQKFGSHYLASLFQYLRTARVLFERSAEERSETRTGRRVRAPARADGLVLSRRAVILRGIHDAPRIFQAIQEAGGASVTISPTLRRRRLDLLIFVPPGTDAIRSFYLAPETASLLGWLEAPRSGRQIAGHARRLGGDPKEAREFLEELRRQEIVLRFPEHFDAPIRPPMRPVVRERIAAPVSC